MTTNVCKEHSGLRSEIDNLKKADEEQWKEIGKMRDKLSGVYTRLNVILVTILAALIALIGNLIIGAVIVK